MAAVMASGGSKLRTLNPACRPTLLPMGEGPGMRVRPCRILREQPDGGLLDKLVFGVGVRAHGVLGVRPFSSSATEGTAPLSALGSESTSLVT